MIRLPRLLAVSCLGTGAVLLLGDALLSLRPPLTPLSSSAQLQRVRRFSPDPVRRREASLLLAVRSEAAADPQLRLDLLRHQGWGPDPLAALVLKRQGLAAEALRRPQQAHAHWRTLLRRFPQDAASADALYSLGRQQPDLRRVLLRRFPAHPAALAAALEAGPSEADRQLGLLHLARWGARWPGAQERFRDACRQGPLTPSERGAVASALAELGDDAAALACLRPGSTLSGPARLALARTLVRGTPDQQARGLALLVDLVRGAGPQAEEALRLLAARAQYWQGEAQQQLGQGQEARELWKQLSMRYPGGYYGWRAAVQLGQGDLRLRSGQPLPQRLSSWQPLASGDAALERLWRLDQRDEAWETWRSRRGGVPPQQARELLLEGRLRQGVGDDWTGLEQLERAQRLLPADQCSLETQLERDLHPRRFEDAFAAAARRHQLSEALLLGLAKQESRFTPGVRSGVGAVGLMQLMPETAAELAGRPLTSAELEDPQRNADLGALYLRQLLSQWQGNPLLTVASYNAGPGAVAGWINPRLSQAPELWVEAIPYPETRLYVKKVLGNVWSYQQQQLPGC